MTVDEALSWMAVLKICVILMVMGLAIALGRA